jgi:hypothetical protein
MRNAEEYALARRGRGSWARRGQYIPLTCGFSTPDGGSSGVARWLSQRKVGLDRKKFGG